MLMYLVAFIIKYIILVPNYEIIINVTVIKVK